MNWDWVAGFMEGEGHIYWQWGKKGTKQGTCGRIIIGQKDKRPLDAMRRFLLDEGIENPILYLRPKTDYKYSTELWMLTISRRGDVVLFLESIQDKLFQKADKAKLVLSRLKHLIEERDTILEQAMELKQQGLSWREVSRRTGVGGVSLRNYFRSKGVTPSDARTPKVMRQEWRNDRVARGLCESCGDTRGKDGTTRKCRVCADRYNQYRRQWTLRKKSGK